MARLRRQDSFEEVQKAGHFRSVTPLQVLAGVWACKLVLHVCKTPRHEASDPSARPIVSGAGKIFNPNLPSLLEAAGSPHIRFPTRAGDFEKVFHDIR